MPDINSTPLYLVPFEYIEYRLLNYLAQELGMLFETEVIFGAKQPLPAASYNQYRSQHRANAFLETLQKLNLEGQVIGITNVDIYAPKFDYLFSITNTDTKIAVISVVRMKPVYYKMYQDETVYWLRVLKEAIHAAGRIYGIDHCFRQECVMHSSKTILNIDIKADRLCGDCRRLLQALLEKKTGYE